MKEVTSGVWGMWSGNASGNNNVKYNGFGNDRSKILNKVGVGTPNATITGYFKEDINLDGKVKYNGFGNDRSKVLQNVGVGTPNNIVTEQL